MKHNQNNAAAITVSRETVVAVVRRLLRTGHDREAEAIAAVLPAHGPTLTEAEATRLDHLVIEADEAYGLAAAALEGQRILVRN